MSLQRALAAAHNLTETAIWMRPSIYCTNLLIAIPQLLSDNLRVLIHGGQLELPFMPKDP